MNELIRRRGSPTARSDLDVLEAFYVAFNGGDVDTAVEFLHPEFEWSPAFGRNLIGSNLYVGRDGFRRYVADLAEAFSDYHVETLATEVVGEQVLLTTRAVGRGRISGIAVDQRFTIRYRFRAGLIASGKTYRDHAMALRDARRR